MATKRTPKAAPATPPASNRPPYMLIEQIQVKGYKSLVDATLHVRPLTLLAGTNSSGKSSILQPFLLVKQTMESSYEPIGSLLLDGSHIQAETAQEIVGNIKGENKVLTINTWGKEVWRDEFHSISYTQIYSAEGNNFYLKQQTFSFEDEISTLIPGTSSNDLSEEIKYSIQRGAMGIKGAYGEIIQTNGFLRIQMKTAAGENIGKVSFTHLLENALSRIMHIPGLRSIPKRSYLATTFENQVKGTFDLYAAGTISQWQQQGNTIALAQTNEYLHRLGLTDSVTAKVKNANEVELSVSRLPVGSKTRKKADMVNIADVGIGVSQVLPIVVALIAAQEGQIVYVEQPELHLHPRAQVVMAELLAEAANRGVRVIVETHSSLILLTVQTLIAENKIANTDVALHWFARDSKGATQVTYVQPDEDGAYGEWPEDFGDVELKAQDAYLTAVGKRHFGNVAE
ncbi:hypothetical protein EJV47_08895 [Hymenobacter gummosus]|uniref:Endonuclease GajA/Old nuclease/RecF-like AAA domain-containing protein n=1 Tax=Hymenobacter gummosus TaxID=1776032 RepID=A0A3S0H7M9_9BACT|nr:AAA family ATPase [Hymenobacter gummosus]RTQ50735.1 hypothetical protein EJV47_08895 [Hymenobacter gummosus]